MRTHGLQDLFTHAAPFVTVHAEVGRTTEDARQQLDARWTSARHELEHAGVGSDLVDEIGRRLQEPPPTGGEARRTIVAADGRVVLDEVQAGHATLPEAVDVAPLPDLTGYLALADRQVPFALVVADREGADIGFHPGLGAVDHHQTTVQGEDFHITKVPQGDWAHRKFQQTAENAWTANARDVAEEVRSGLRSHRADVVLLAGDERARHLIADALAVDAPVVHVEAGGRAAGASQDALWEEVRRHLADVEARADAEILDRLAAASGQSEAATRGVDEVLEALVRGQVEVLVLDPDAAREEQVDPGDHPGLALPPGAAGPLPADRVLVAGAVATGADVRLLSREVADPVGVAALLRWEDGAEPRDEV